MDELFHSLLFASDAALMALVGVGFWLFAALALVLERRRVRKRNLARLERVGFMPWTALFLASVVIGGGMLAMSLPVVLGSL